MPTITTSLVLWSLFVLWGVFPVVNYMLFRKLFPDAVNPGIQVSFILGGPISVLVTLLLLLVGVVFPVAGYLVARLLIVLDWVADLLGKLFRPVAYLLGKLFRPVADLFGKLFQLGANVVRKLFSKRKAS